MPYTLYNIKFLSKNSGRYLRPDKKSLFSILKPGNYARLMLRTIDNKTGFIGIEKVWVTIDRLEKNQYFGRLVTIPQVIKDLKIGDIIPFAYDYVLGARPGAVMTNRLDMGNSEMRCLVSEKVLNFGVNIGAGIREMPTLYKDSGWRFFSNEAEISDFPKGMHSVPIELLSFTRDDLDVSLGSIMSFSDQSIKADTTKLWIPRSSRA
jgi:Uncharacterized protein conserved in bacteria